MKNASDILARWKGQLLTIKRAEANGVILKVVNNQVVSKDNICSAQ